MKYIRSGDAWVIGRRLHCDCDVPEYWILNHIQGYVMHVDYSSAPNLDKVTANVWLSQLD